MSYWVEAIYMIANALTKHDPNDQCLWDLLMSGTWNIGGEVRIRTTARVQDFTEDDLYDMNRAKAPHPFAPPNDGEMLCMPCYGLTLCDNTCSASGL